MIYIHIKIHKQTSLHHNLLKINIYILLLVGIYTKKYYMFSFSPAILGLERIDSFQADVIQGLSCIAKYRFPIKLIKLGMTGGEKKNMET